MMSGNYLMWFLLKYAFHFKSIFLERILKANIYFVHVVM